MATAMAVANTDAPSNFALRAPIPKEAAKEARKEDREAQQEDSSGSSSRDGSRMVVQQRARPVGSEVFSSSGVK